MASNTKYMTGKVNNVMPVSHRIMSMLIITLMVAGIVFTAIPVMSANEDNDGKDTSSLSSLANVIMAKADDGTDFPGSDESEYSGCPGNNGKDTNDTGDNDARQICWLKNKDVDATTTGDDNDNLSDSGTDKDGKKKKTGDSEWNYNNLTGTITDGDYSSYKKSKYGYDKCDKKTGDCQSTFAETSVFDTWSMIISRTINPSYYINNDIPNSDSDDRTAALKWQMGNHTCSGLDSVSAYDNTNCDVPGIVTQAYQDIVYTVFDTGIQNGNKISGRSPFNIGLPIGLIPTDSNGETKVPIAGNRGSNKYTGLEIFGYNLKWTTYKGEWDKIDVPTEARLSANMKIFSTLVAAAKSAFSNAVSGANQDVVDAWNSGNLLKLAGAILSWPLKVIKNSITGTLYFFINGVMNGYEHGVIQENSWNRNDFYRDSSYNVRVLSDSEQSAIYRYLTMKIAADKVSEEAGKHDVDTDAIEKQAELPNNSPKAPSDSDLKDKSDEEKMALYKKAWDEWIKKNQDKFDWGEENLNIKTSDYDAFFKTANSSNNNGNDGSSDAGDETRSPLDKAYEKLSSDWNTRKTQWVQDEEQKQQNANTNAIQKVIEDLFNGANEDEIRQEVQKKLANNAIMFFCTDGKGGPNIGMSSAPIKNGNPSTGNDSVDLALEAGLQWPGQAAFSIDENGDATPNDCANGKMRQPIVGALNGQAGTTQQINSHRDTRRAAVKGISILDILHLNPERFAGAFLSISQKIAMGINFMVNLSFTPLLESLGIKDIVVGTIETLRDSMYMQCLQIFIVLGVMYVLFKYIAGRSREGIKQVLLVCLSAIIGVVLLQNPSATFKLIDEYPTAVEKAFAAVILQSASPNEKLCSATGTPSEKLDSKGYESPDGSQKFDPNSIVRSVECNIWDAYVLEPWSLGQFGVSTTKLYAEGYAPYDGKTSYGTMDADDATNTLVGNAAVDMGGGTTINNWALYQLSQQISGTSTTDDSTQTMLATDSDMYRLVDLQAGPDNATGKDTSHWNWWIGGGNRFGVGLLALLSSLGGIMSIGMFALAKIEATFMMALLLAMAPVMLLIGIIPGAGRIKMRSWAFKILGLAFKRIILISLLSVQIVILIQVAATNTDDAVANMIVMACLSILFAMYGKEIIKMFTAPIDEQTGAFNDMDDRIKNQLKNSRAMITLRGMQRGLTQSAGSLVGSVIAGGFERNDARSVFNRWDSAQRDKAAEIRDKELSDINKKRKQIMDSYNHGSISGNAYQKAQQELNEQEADVQKNYRANIDAIKNQGEKFDTDFNVRASILNDPAYRAHNEGTQQIKNTLGRARMEIEQQNRKAGNNFLTGQAIQTGKDEKAAMIQHAYDNIMVNNPDIARSLLGNNYEDAAKLMKGVDLREINDMLNISDADNVHMTQEQMEQLGATYRIGPDGRPVLMLPDELQRKFRETALNGVKDADAGTAAFTANVHLTTPQQIVFNNEEERQAAAQSTLANPSDEKLHAGTRLREHFANQDVAYHKLDAVNKIAAKYIPADAAALQQLRDELNAHFNNSADRATIASISDDILNNPFNDDSIDAAHAGNYQAMKDAFKRKYDSEIQNINANAMISKDEQAKRKAQARADYERNVSSLVGGASENRVLQQATLIADAKLAMNLDKLDEAMKDTEFSDRIRGIYIDNDGTLHVEAVAKGHSKADQAQAIADFEKDNKELLAAAQQNANDLIEMAASCGVQSSRFAIRRDANDDEYIRDDKGKAKQSARNNRLLQSSSKYSGKSDKKNHGSLSDILRQNQKDGDKIQSQVDNETRRRIGYDSASVKDSTIIGNADRSAHHVQPSEFGSESSNLPKFHETSAPDEPSMDFKKDYTTREHEKAAERRKNKATRKRKDD